MPTLSKLRRALRLTGFTPSKTLGQNFLFEHRVLAAIAREVGATGNDVVLEIGCGCGFLTMHLTGSAKKVLAVEIDATLAGVAGRFLSEFPNVEILQADILTQGEVNPVVAEQLRELGGCDLVAGSLPYSAATAIVSALGRWDFTPRALVFLFQEEVARRLAAGPGTSDYGALSVITGAAFEVELLLKIGSEVFWPSPKVESRLVRLKPREFGGDLKGFGAFVHALFAQPRKTAVNSLISGAERSQIPSLPHSRAELRERVAGVLDSLGIDPGTRPGQLSLVQVEAIFKKLVPES
jgi:16S rRNA (adenine1518-N6/adenine1519-N6)-dimethyltransferase